MERQPSFRQKQKVDNFILEEPLGSGQDGEVWRATRTSIGKTCAIKFLNSVEEEDKQARFDREIKILASLNHAHIIQIQDKGEAWNPESGAIVPYYVMEFLPGRPIDKALVDLGDDHRLEAFCLLFQQVCSALDAAHARGISHGDIKPANILVINKDRLAKLTDFGFGLLPGDIKKSRQLYPDSSYKAPETLTPVLADVFRLGKTIIDCLDRLPNLKGLAAMRQLLSIANRMAENPADVNLSDVRSILEQTRTATLPKTFVTEPVSEAVPELDSATKGKLITDPIYGVENFTLRTMHLLDSHSFQSLRTIREFSSAELVFPALTVSAFEQALGEHAMLVRQLEWFAQATVLREILTPTQLSTVILAGLMLSGSRTPFHSVLGRALPDVSLKMQAKALRLFEEEISKLIVEEWKVEPQLLTRLLEKEASAIYRYSDNQEDPDWRLMSDLLYGPLSASSSEWVFRSSSRVGLQTAVDIRDLFRALSIWEKGQVVVMEGKTRTVEAFYLAKIQATERFYYQPTIRGADLMLEHAFALLYEHGIDFPALVAFGDHDFFAACIEEAKHSKDPTTLQLLKNYQERILHKRLISVSRNEIGSPYWPDHFGRRFADEITYRFQSRFHIRIDPGAILADVSHYSKKRDLMVLMKDGGLRHASGISASFAALQEGPETSNVTLYASPKVRAELQPHSREIRPVVEDVLYHIMASEN